MNSYSPTDVVLLSDGAEAIVTVEETIGSLLLGNREEGTRLVNLELNEDASFEAITPPPDGDEDPEDVLPPVRPVVAPIA